jgi:addiction module HigA family antidote
MNNINKQNFEPFIVDPTLAGDPTHPSEILVDELEYRKVSNQEFAQKMELDIDFINQFLQAKRPVTPEIALKIESILGIDAGFWLRMQSNYEMAKIRIRMRKQIEKASISNQEKEKLRKSI